jgi:hypothetical protein
VGKARSRRVPGGSKALSRKVAKVKREAKAKGKRLTNEQAVGKAAGTLRHRAKKKAARKAASSRRKARR